MNPPIKDYKQSAYPNGNISQWFGANPDLYKRFGFIGHSGLDVVAPYGTPILAVEAGTVINVKNDPEGFGKHVRVLSNASEGGYFREWGYAHLSEIDVKVGQKVAAGEKLGEMGNTGFVVSGATPFWKYNPYAGTHLHLQMRYVEKNPSGWKYPGSNIAIEVVNYDNGYKGCVNIAHFFEDTTTRKQKLLTIISLANQVISLLKRLNEQKNG